ncbi:peptide-methionine (S)-S-oxide reductase MsrA [Pontibacter oryzae]|uniref:Peptide methionine sulfoxide reductase MsrA n=1 Tax=Pontibacter oryzae TaxID=2304593 RepID=A0A399SEK3_9BACT|nr:peptide-methionine (S)-S-oxide reductase MsrA [Pontibacter oryzae]RIJ41628.1 peptide-methionine (S)-S-oxide reductase [Pontibacter oryzae]
MITRTLLLLISILFCFTSCTEATNNNRLQATSSPPQNLSEDTVGLAKATFAGGCFWCTEAYFERLQGVQAVVSGYAGGKSQNPTYQQVSAGSTDYAECVQVYYNPQQISYKELLEVFFATHDPTTLNRQGPDHGKQYRSVVFYRTPEEKKMTEQYITDLEQAGAYPNKIVTYVQPFKKFWPAEGYHQDYYKLNPKDPYVQAVAKPKVKKFESNFQNKLKPEYSN